MRNPVRLGAILTVAGALLAGCGGGDDDDHKRAACSIPQQQVALRDYMADWYFWYALSPRPDPAGFGSVEEYFDALLYQGGDPSFPADRWSYLQPEESYDRFYGEGRTLGYGVDIAVEFLSGWPQVLVRNVEPQSPAGLAGITRGERILAVNGLPVAQIIANNDYSYFPRAAGDRVTWS